MSGKHARGWARRMGRRYLRRFRTLLHGAKAVENGAWPAVDEKLERASWARLRRSTLR